MHKDGEEVHLSEEEASGGSKDGVVRWVLIFGTLIAIIALSAIWITGAATSDQVETAEATDHLGAPLPAQTSDEQQTVENDLPVVKN